MAKHLVIGYKGSVGSRHYRLLQEAGEEVIGWDEDEFPEYGFIDMVWICTPEKQKQFYLNQFNGDKIFIEKPLSVDTSQFTGDLWLACNYRFHPAVQVLKENLHKVGDVLYSRMHFSHYLPNQRENWKEYMKDTNIVLDVGYHFTDLALWLFGKPNYHFVKHCQISEEYYDYAKIELSYDYEYDKLVRTKSRSIIKCQIDIDYLRRDKSWGIEIVGKEGTLKLQSFSKNPEKTMVQFNDGYCWCDTLFMREVNSDEPFKNQLNYLLKNNWKSNIDQSIEVMKICS